MKLTNAAIAALKLEDKRDLIAFDDDLKGFGIRLRLGASGKVFKTWIVQWKRGGATRRILIGSAEVLNAAQARTAAKEKLAQVALGKDPAADRRDRRAKDALTLRSQVTEFLAAKEADLAPRSFAESTRYLTDPRYFGPLHRLALDQIALKDVAARIVAIQRECGNAAAARARAVLTGLFTWAMRMGLAASNPCIGSITPETKARDRVLSPDELSRIWKACGSDDYGCIVRLLILTACRRAEIGDMRWPELDFERGTFTIPAERAKTEKARVIPLLPMMLDIINGVPQRATRDQLFGDRSHGYTSWPYGKPALDARSSVSGWVVHDLRRSAATHLAEQCAIAPHVIEMLLGHEPFAKVQKTYNRSPYEREIRDAYLRWHDYLRTLIAGGERKVLPYPQLLA
jgi:integrase